MAKKVSNITCVIVVFYYIFFNHQSPAVMSLITEKDVNGFSAVHYAAMKGDVQVRRENKTEKSL